MTRRPWNNPYSPAPPRTNICPYCRREAAPGPVCPCPEQQWVLALRNAAQIRRAELSRTGVATSFTSKIWRP